MPAPSLNRAVGHVSLPSAGLQRLRLQFASFAFALSFTSRIARLFILSALLVAVLPREISLQGKILILIDGAHIVLLLSDYVRLFCRARALNMPAFGCIRAHLMEMRKRYWRFTLKRELFCKSFPFFIVKMMRDHKNDALF